MIKKIHVKKGETVKVISGKDKNKTGKVLVVMPKTGKIIVEGINIATKHTKARKQGDQSAIIKVDAPIYACKVQLYCPKCDKGVRVHAEISYKEQDGKQKKVVTRVCAKCGYKFD